MPNNMTEKTTTRKEIVVPQVALPQKRGRRPAPRTEAVMPAVSEAQENVYELMDRKDDQQILAELQGRFLDEYVYEFPQDGKTVTGLSWIGTKEASREYGGIQVPLEKLKIITEDDKSVTVAVESFDVYTGTSRIGLKRQQKHLRLRDGRVLENPFYFEQAVSKAQRNAINAVIPYTFVKAWIQLKRKGATPRQIQEAEQQIQDIKEQSVDQKKIQIAALLKKLGHSPQSPAEYQKVVKDITNIKLEPQNYDEVISRLQVSVAELNGHAKL